MLSSWFSKNPQDTSAQQERPSRRSYDLFRTQSASISTGNDLNVPRSSLDISKSPNRRSPLPYSTPHDVVLSQLQPTPRPQASLLNGQPLDGKSGRPIDEWGHTGQPHSMMSGQESNASQSRVDLGMSPAPSPYPSATVNSRHPGTQNNSQIQPQPSVDIFYDAYDGLSLGVLVPQDESQDENSSPRKLITEGAGTSSEAMWSHLSRVLDLQSHIARMHIEMEGVGLGDGKKMKGKPGTFGMAPSSMEERGTFRGHSKLRKRTMSNVSTVSSDDEKGADEEGVGVGMGDEEADLHKAREEEFAKLADQFEGKKESIRDIMGKLDELSKALTDFHALQAPKVEISSSRRSSLGATQSNPPLPAPIISTQHVLGKPFSHASLPPFPTLWTPPKTPFSTTSPTILPQSFSRIEPQPQQAQLPTVLVNSMELGAKTHAMVESPMSTTGSLQLHPE